MEEKRLRERKALCQVGLVRGRERERWAVACAEERERGGIRSLLLREGEQRGTRESDKRRSVENSERARGRERGSEREGERGRRQRGDVEDAEMRGRGGAGM